MWLVSPSPGVVEVPGSNPPIAGPSLETFPPLFEEQALSAGEEVGPAVPASLGE